tara:strand:- start:80 stop:823 length:744 start_codon:yes stop_codon:yes gene_type:complete
MARISSYPLDTNITDKDAWIGTNAANQSTKQFTALSLAEYVVSSISGITGSGTINTIPMFTPSGVKLGDSIITQAVSGQSITVTGQLDVTEDFNVSGSAEFTGSVSVNEQLFDGDGSIGTAGQVLSSTGTQTEWVDPSAAITKLIPYFQLATPGGSATYTQSNNIVDFDWSGGSGTYEYILPSATAIPYRTIRFVNNSTITASDKIHITAPGTETIDGGAFYSINKPYNGCAVWSDGVQWIVIQAKG